MIKVAFDRVSSSLLVDVSFADNLDCWESLVQVFSYCTFGQLRHTVCVIFISVVSKVPFISSVQKASFKFTF